MKDGEKIEINRFFAERGREMVEIQKSEYVIRKMNFSVKCDSRRARVFKRGDSETQDGEVQAGPDG